MPYLFPEGASLGADNVVLHAQARRHRVDNYRGPLSIKTVLRGRVSWIVGGRTLTVDRSSVLILGAGEPYSMDIDAPDGVETCCAFFSPGFVERVALDVTSPLEHSLEMPELPPDSLPWLSALHGDRERALGKRVQSLAQRCSVRLFPSGFEEDFLLLAADLLEHYQQIREQSARIPAVRESTRRELYRRLLIGRDFIHSQTPGPVSLTTIARTACVSPFHFHRGFSRAFGMTPHAYVTELRLENARAKILRGSSVLEACVEAGFSSPSAFTRLFRARYGEAPAPMRRKFARSGRKDSSASGTLDA